MRGSPSFVIILCAMSLLLLPSCGGRREKAAEPDAIRPIKMLTVTSGADGLKRRMPARVRASQRADMAFQISGTLIELPVDEGQQISKGDLLARLDPRDFKVRLQEAEGQLSRGKAALDLAKSQHERVLRIKEQDPGAVSDSLVDSRRERENSARADLQSLQAAVDAARLQLSYTELSAPFTGVVARRYVDNFQEVKAKQPIISLQDISRIEILVDVPENMVATMTDSMRPTIFVEFQASPGETYPLTVKEYTTEADPRTQTYQVTLEMPQPEGLNIFPGMTATVVGIRPAERVGGGEIPVPVSAVFADEAGVSHVWVVEPESMTIHCREVSLGELSGTDEVVIAEGLQIGEQIAISGVDQLREGMKVRLLDI